MTTESTENGLYSNGAEFENETCVYAITHNALYIYLTQHNNRLVIWNLQQGLVSESKEEHIVFFHGNTEKLVGSGPIARLLSSSHHVPTPSSEVYQSKISRKSLYMILGITGVFLFLGVLAYFFLMPWLGEKAVSLVPIDTEIEMGSNLSAVYTADTETNDSVNDYLKKFVALMRLESRYPVEVNVILSDEINAFALPGGKIFIYSGILKKMQSPEELAALISHEVTHVQQRHSLKSIFRSLASSMLIGVLLGDLSGASSGILAQADQFKQLDYSRELETEADTYGLELMVKNRINPKGMLDLLLVLKKETASAPQMMKYLSTHPDTEERIKNFKNQKQAGLFFSERPDLRLIFERIKENAVD